MKNNNSDVKYIKKTFFVHQYEEEEEFLRSMRREGWKFVKLYRGIPTKYEFQRCEPEEYIYRLDYITPENDTEDYHQLYKDYGWEELLEWNTVGGKWYYLGKRSDDRIQRLYSDIDSKIEFFNLLWKKYAWLLFVCALMELNGIFIYVKEFSKEGLRSGWGVFLLAGILVFSGILGFIGTIIMGMIKKKNMLVKQKENVL